MGAPMISFGIRAAKRQRQHTTAHAAFTSSAVEEDPSEGNNSEKITLTRDAARARGNTLAEAGDFSAAVTAFDTALRLLPAQQQQGETDASLEVNPRGNIFFEATLHELKAQCLTALDRDYDAVQSARTSTELCPDWADAHVTLGRAQINLGEPKLALASFGRALDLESDHTEATEEVDRVRRILASMSEDDDTRAASTKARLASVERRR